jgi:hypothetical protein
VKVQREERRKSMVKKEKGKQRKLLQRIITRRVHIKRTVGTAAKKVKVQMTKQNKS